MIRRLPVLERLPLLGRLGLGLGQGARRRAILQDVRAAAETDGAAQA